MTNITTPHPPGQQTCGTAGCGCGLPGDPGLLLWTEDIAGLAGFAKANSVKVLAYLSRKRRDEGNPWPGDLPAPARHEDRKITVRNASGDGSHVITVRDAPRWSWAQIKPWLARRDGKAGAS